MSFTGAEIMAHASDVREYFAARPADTLYRLPMKVQRDLNEGRSIDPTGCADATPTLEIKRPR